MKIILLLMEPYGFITEISFVCQLFRLFYLIVSFHDCYNGIRNITSFRISLLKLKVGVISGKIVRLLGRRTIDPLDMKLSNG